jgi:hypothetical protein
MDAFRQVGQEVMTAPPGPVTVLGIDETRRGRMQWRQDPGTGRWEPTADRWHTGCVDATGIQGRMGQVEDRAPSNVPAWPATTRKPWRAQIAYVAIDMSPGYRAAVRTKEKLRDLLARARTTDRHRTGHLRWKFLTWCADCDILEVRTLARTIDRWWPEIQAFIATGLSNAKSEGINRMIKLAARAAHGFRDPTDQRLRTRCVTTRRARGHLRPA